jgi:hypothetical protein
MYFVRASGTGSPKRIEFRYRDLGPALGQACALVKSGAPDVSIRDSRDNHIEGSELAACCRGERTLNSDLRPKSRPVQTLLLIERHR